MWELHEDKELAFKQFNSIKAKKLNCQWFINPERQGDIKLERKNIKNEGLNKLRKIKKSLSMGKRRKME